LVAEIVGKHPQLMCWQMAFFSINKDINSKPHTECFQFKTLGRSIKVTSLGCDTDDITKYFSTTVRHHNIMIQVMKLRKMLKSSQIEQGNKISI
jgi:hypothetical protein